MKNYTEKEAIQEIFNRKPLPAKDRVLKSRYTNGKLSQKAIDGILKKEGFQSVQEKLYIKN